MLFELDADQRALLDAVERILDGNAGAARARALGGDRPRYDHDLAGLLRDQGFLGFRFEEGAGPLEAALVVKAVARAGGVVAAGADALVAPGAISGESVISPGGGGDRRVGGVRCGSPQTPRRSSWSVTTRRSSSTSSAVTPGRWRPGSATRWRRSSGGTGAGWAAARRRSCGHGGASPSRSRCAAPRGPPSRRRSPTFASGSSSAARSARSRRCSTGWRSARC